MSPNIMSVSFCEATAGNNCEFSNPALVSSDVISNCLTIVRALSKWDSPSNNDVMLKLCQFTFPSGTYKDAASFHVPWIERERKDSSRIKTLLKPVTETRAFKRSQRAEEMRLSKLLEVSRWKKVVENDAAKLGSKLPEPQPDETPEEEVIGPPVSEQKPRKVAAKGKAAKPKEKPKAQQPEEVILATVTTAKGEERQCLLVDDMLNAIEFAIESFKETIDFEIDSALVNCLEFLLTGELTIADPKDGTKTILLDTWSSTRKAVKQQLALGHKAVPRKDDPNNDEKNTATAVAVDHVQGKPYLDGLLQFLDRAKSPEKHIMELMQKKNQ